MVKPVELSQEDLLRAAMPAEPAAGDSDSDDGDAGDMLTTIRQFNLEVQQTMSQFKDLLSLVSAIRGGGVAPGMMGAGFRTSGPVAGSPPPAMPTGPAGPDPKQQVLAGLQQIQAEVGDVTLVELVTILTRQYGGLRLSDIIARIK
jgi:hypothetical protein